MSGQKYTILSVFLLFVLTEGSAGTSNMTINFVVLAVRAGHDGAFVITFECCSLMSCWSSYWRAVLVDSCCSGRGSYCGCGGSGADLERFEREIPRWLVVCTANM